MPDAPAPAPTPAFWQRRDWLAAGITFLSTLLFYTWHLPPSVTLEDAGELAVAARWMGIPHPPGYPLWTYLTWWVQRPFPANDFHGLPNPARAVAFASALYGALACAAVTLLLSRALRHIAQTPSDPLPQPNRPHAHSLRLRLRLILWFSALLLPVAIPQLGIRGLLLYALTALLLAFLWIWPPLHRTLPACLRFPRPPPVPWLAEALSAFLWGSVIVATLWHLLDPPAAWQILLLGLPAAACLQLRLPSKRFSTPPAPWLPPLCAVSAGLLLALSPLMWSQSVLVEVYSLNAFVLALLLCLAYQFLHRPAPGLLYSGAFLFALGLANHQSLTFLLPALLLIPLLQPDFRLTSLRLPLLLLLLLSSGLAFHAYLPIASEQNPPMNWGYARTADGFRHLVTRGQYERFAVRDNLTTLLEKLTPPDFDTLRAADPDTLPEWTRQRRFLGHQLGALFLDPREPFSLAAAFSPPRAQSWPLPLFALGLLPLLFPRRFDSLTRNWLAHLTLALFCFTLLFMLIQWPALDIHDLFVKRVQYIPAHLLFALLIGLGTFQLLRALPRPAHLPAALLLWTALLSGPWLRETRDPRHHRIVGTASQRGHDFGWRYGAQLLCGIDAFLLHELHHHDDPSLSFPPDLLHTLQHTGTPPEILDILSRFSHGPRSTFKREIAPRLPPAHRQPLLEAGLLAAFRALDPATREASLRWLHRLPPDLSYPPPLSPNAILFGGTDPGRFVPTYLVYGANLRPDLHILTQNALADPGYLNTLRDLYGHRIWIPDPVDSHDAFRRFADHLRVTRPDAFAALIDSGDTLTAEGVQQVNHINHTLLTRIARQNHPHHPVYLEESFPIPELKPYLRPHGLLFRYDPHPARLRQTDIDRNMDFWEWLTEHLLRDPRFHTDVMARRSWSKLRSAQAGWYAENDRHPEAVHAFQQSLRLDPDNAETVFRFAERLTRWLRFDEAEQLIADYAHIDPRHPQLPVFRRGLTQLRDLNQRRLAAEAAWDRQPSGNLALQLAQLYALLAQTPQMQEAVQLLLEMPQLAEDFYPFLRDFLREQQDLPLLELTLTRWAGRFPHRAEPLLDLAALALSRQDFPLALRRLETALQREPRLRPALPRDPRFRDLQEWPPFLQLLQTP